MTSSHLFPVLITVETFCFCIGLLCQIFCVVNLSVNALADTYQLENSLDNYSHLLDTTPHSFQPISLLIAFEGSSMNFLVLIFFVGSLANLTQYQYNVFASTDVPGNSKLMHCGIRYHHMPDIQVSTVNFEISRAVGCPTSHALPDPVITLCCYM